MLAEAESVWKLRTIETQKAQYFLHLKSTFHEAKQINKYNEEHEEQ